MKKPNREDLIKLLVRELIRREPDMAAHEADARYRVTHTSPGSVDTVRDLALNARVHDLISEEEYLRAAPNSRETMAAIRYQREKVAENRRHRASQKAQSAILTDAQGRPLDKPKRADFTSDIAFIHATHAHNDKVAGIANRAFDEGLHAAMARPALPPGTSAAEVELFDTVRSGDKVTIINRFGQISTGRAVMRGPAGWVLNMGGRHGTPAIASPDNITAVRIPKSKR